MDFPAVLDVPRFREAWEKWIADRRERRLKPLTTRGQVIQLNRLVAIGPDKAIECIDESIANGWQGLFPQHFANGGKNGFKTHDERVLDTMFPEGL